MLCIPKLIYLIDCLQTVDTLLFIRCAHLLYLEP